MRRLVHSAVAEYADLVPNGVPPEICARLGSWTERGLRHLHLPSLDATCGAEQRHLAGPRAVVFDELFYLQLGMALRRRQMVKETALDCAGPLVRHLHEVCRSASLMPKSAYWIDLSRHGCPHPMNRLCRGTSAQANDLAFFAALPRSTAAIRSHSWRRPSSGRATLSYPAPVG